ncbi:MAG: PAS domain S-box protein, partial [Gaiellaceae bacterium]
MPTGRDPNAPDTRRLVALVARSRALTGVIAADGTPLYLSPAAVELHTGRRTDELSVSTGSDLIHPDDYEVLAASFDVSLARPREPIPVRYRTLHADGSWRIIAGTYTNLLGELDIAGVVLDVNDVTDQANAENALRASEARNRRVIDSLAEGIILTGEGDRIVACNQAAVEIFGLSVDEIMHHTPEARWNLTSRDGTPIAPEDAPAAKTRRTGEPCRDVVMAVHRPDGGCSWISANSVVIDFDEGGRPELVAVSLTDITALVESTAEIEHNERRFRALIAKSSDVVTIIDPDLRIGYVSGAVEQILGYRVDEMIGRDASGLIHPDDLEPALSAVARRTLGSVPERLEIRLLHAEGHWVYVEALGTNLMDDPLVGGIAVNLRDISERRRIEATLRDAQVRFEEAFEHAPIGMAMLRHDGRFFRVNPAFCRMLEYTNDEL